MRTTLLLILALFISACSQQPESVTVEQPAEAKKVTSVIEVASADEYQPDYISAADLNSRVVDCSSPFVFDVRSSHSYEKSHLLGSWSMPHGKTDDALLATVEGLSKDSEIVTYCGCPRHLATLAAKNLESRGYNNVMVLYEGYWHWVEKGYPTVEQSGNVATTTRLYLQGRIFADDDSGSGIDVFMRHADTGQLEAAETDANGHFEMDFTLYDYVPGDAFSVVLHDISNEPVHQLYVPEDSNVDLEITL